MATMNENEPTENRRTAGARLRPGMVDIHSHLIPGVDDGCVNLDQSLDTVQRLIDTGYAASFCTPHIWPDGDRFCDNTPSRIAEQAAWLQDEIAAAGLDYTLLPGGELRLFDGVVEWMTEYGVPVLGDSRCVLLDIWVHQWPAWADRALAWLVEHRYQPILAHPERIKLDADALDRTVGRLASRGVLLQGNFHSMTGANGQQADRLIRKWLGEDRLDLLALDAHKPHDLDTRFDGLALVEAEFGPETVQALTDTAPRRLLGLP